MIRQFYPDCPASNTHTKKNAKNCLFLLPIKYTISHQANGNHLSFICPRKENNTEWNRKWNSLRVIGILSCDSSITPKTAEVNGRDVVQ